MDEREMFLDWWCDEVPEYLRESWKHSVSEVLDTKDASEKLACAWDTWQAARRTTPDREAVIEECAKVCDEYAADQWSLYKGRAPYNGSEPGRADPDVQGRSDGADVCAERIRALKVITTSDKGGA